MHTTILGIAPIELFLFFGAVVYSYGCWPQLAADLTNRTLIAHVDHATAAAHTIECDGGHLD